MTATIRIDPLRDGVEPGAARARDIMGGYRPDRLVTEAGQGSERVAEYQAGTGR
jgi:hypothetical protein